VASTWKLGREGKDDGVLFLVARNDRKMRIEVGYGSRRSSPTPRVAASSTTWCGRVSATADFAGGIEAGLDAILGQIDGTGTLPEGPPPSQRPPWPRSCDFAAVPGGGRRVLPGRGVRPGGVAWMLYSS